MLGIDDAEHMEDAISGTPLITAIACAVGEAPTSGPVLSGRSKIVLSTKSMAHQIYGRQEIEEEYACGFNLNPDFQHFFEEKGLRIVGRGEDQAARVTELVGHRFFVGTLFLPQFSSREGQPHPLITAFLEAAMEFSKVNPNLDCRLSTNL